MRAGSGRSGRQTNEVRPAPQPLDFSLLRDLKRVINLDPEVSDSAFQLAMSEQELNGAQVLRSLVDQRGLSPAHRVSTVDGRVESYSANPLMNDPSVLPRRNMRRLR